MIQMFEQNLATIKQSHETLDGIRQIVTTLKNLLLIKFKCGFN